MTDYITVRNWENFQHGDVARNKIRAPAWIRVYTELHKDEAFLALTGHRRAVLLGVWIEYAASRRRLPDDTATLSRRLALKVTRQDLAALNQAGFLEISHDTVTTPTRTKEIRGEERVTRAVLTALPGGQESGETEGPDFDIQQMLKEMP